MAPNLTQKAPSTFWAMVSRAGPGMIIAGSIVGSGELIATTKTGAEAGFVLLWLIILGCVVKVFTQVELGRYALHSGQTTMAALAEIPGPRIPGRGNWLIWYWFVMWFASVAQLGGIVGGVGQALSISVPLTAQGRAYNQLADASVSQRVAEVSGESSFGQAERSLEQQAADFADLRSSYAAEYGERRDQAGELVARSHGVLPPPDDRIWATVIALLTAVLLWHGRYPLIQSFSTTLVAAFTVLTIVNLILLQRQEIWHVRWGEFTSGLTFGLPGSESSGAAIPTALATFGIIGVGATELVVYPYWCLEKGYGRFTGRNDHTQEWAERARGWMRVMRLDAWGSMVVYTFATIAFYLLGAAVLHRVGLVPQDSEMIRTLAVMYTPVFGTWAAFLFLFGAFAVLYSTFFVANASHSRTFSDAMRVVGLIRADERTKWVRILGAIFPLLCLIIYLLFPRPVVLVLISGVAQGIMLPMLAGAALFFRYRRADPALRPGRCWDLFLWISALAMLVTGTWTVWVKVQPLVTSVF